MREQYDSEDEEMGQDEEDSKGEEPHPKKIVYKKVIEQIRANTDEIDGAEVNMSHNSSCEKIAIQFAEPPAKKKQMIPKTRKQLMKMLGLGYEILADVMRE